MNDIEHSIAAILAELPGMETKRIWELWDSHFLRRPQNPNRKFLESRLAYKLQQDAFGGLSDTTRQRLISIGRQHSKIVTRQTTQPIQLAPGTILLREWGDRDHRVTVTAEGTFSYENQQFKSLSAVARFICGSQVSGPLFFNLKARAKP